MARSARSTESGEGDLWPCWDPSARAYDGDELCSIFCVPAFSFVFPFCNRRAEAWLFADSATRKLSLKHTAWNIKCRTWPGRPPLQQQLSNSIWERVNRTQMSQPGILLIYRLFLCRSEVEKTASSFRVTPAGPMEEYHVTRKKTIVWCYNDIFLRPNFQRQVGLKSEVEEIQILPF